MKPKDREKDRAAMFEELVERVAQAHATLDALHPSRWYELSSEELASLMTATYHALEATLAKVEKLK